MTDKEHFKLWAPKGSKWIDWVRPVMFIGIEQMTQSFLPNLFEAEKIEYIEKVEKDTAIIIDLPGQASLLEGLGCASMGYRPIPLYNGTNPQENSISLVDNKEIQNALAWGSLKLKTLNIDSEAPPAFLLDSNRILRYKMNISVYDNSWDIYDQDMPSVTYFLNSGIDKIIVRSEKIHRDLTRILYKFQTKGIKIFFTNGYDKPKEIHIKKPPKKDKYH